MSFQPPRCPNTACTKHRQPDPKKVVRWGSFSTRCRDRREQRYRCMECRKTFSRQTFRHDYRDRRPDLNLPLFQALSSGVGLRQTARELEVSPSTMQKKMRKLARTCGLLHENLSARLPPDLAYVMDEEESYEQASIRPLTVPILIESTNWFIVASAVGSIRRLAPNGTARRRRQEREEKKYGKRPDQSRACIKQVFSALRRRVTGRVELVTDQKSSYPTVAREVFGEYVVHATTPGSAPRTGDNPLFSINKTIAMSRDNCGRLRRKSWLVSKLAQWLRGQLCIFTVYRNYVRQRFNRDKRHETPAYLLDLLPRQLYRPEVVRWRQDWGRLSIHPMSLSAVRTVGGGAM